MTVNNSTNRYATSQIIVAPTIAEGAMFTSIASAITYAAANGLKNIFIKPGTYTENLTLPANINLTGFTGDSITPLVTIVGKISCTDAGRRTISNIKLQSNADNILSVTGSAATAVNLQNCFLTISGATGINYTSSSSSSGIDIVDCAGDVASNHALFVSSGAGGIAFYRCIFTGSGWTTTASTTSVSVVSFNQGTTIRGALSCSGTGFFVFSQNSNINSSIANTTTLTTSGTAITVINNAVFSSGTASAISIGAGTTVKITECSIDSSNANIITGAGTLEAGLVKSNRTSGTFNPTTYTTYYKDFIGTPLIFGDITQSRSQNGGTVTTTLTNSSNTASSNTLLNLTVAGSSAGDAFSTYTVSGVTNWSQGVDNSNSDAFVTSASTALGTTDTHICTTTGHWTQPLHACFAAENTVNDTNQTGNGATVTVQFNSEFFDQGNNFSANTFTAPVTGKYLLETHVYVSSITTAMTVWQLDIVTTARTYRWEYTNNQSLNKTFTGCVVANMSAGDTAVVKITGLNGAGNTAGIVGSASTGGLAMTVFSGELLA